MRCDTCKNTDNVCRDHFHHNVHLQQISCFPDGCDIDENAHQYLSVCSTLANLLVAAGDYKTAEEQYSHVIWLMLENGYEEDSQTVKEFSERVLEVRRMAQNGSK